MAWNRCANPASVEYNPFLDHRFLHALEASGSVCAKTGWQPFHIVLAEQDDASAAVGVVPMYLKSHSRGEYVFDGGWAEAFYRAGGQYYPKLQVSVPFTPATGRRLLAADGCGKAEGEGQVETEGKKEAEGQAETEGQAKAEGQAAAKEEVEEQLLRVAVEVANRIQVSSLHFTFLPQAQWQRAAQAGCLRRIDTQFHWCNQGYATFDAFVEELSSKKRKNIRRERREAVADGLEIEWLTGDISEAQWDAFYQFYADTGARKWGTPYLNREFFSRVGTTMGERILLIMCKRQGRYIAGAINFIGGDTLYGRNWGCIEDHRFLHFEVCYYQAIDFAIAHGLARVEAGAQGAHKIARGYLPKPTFSAHWIRDAGFRAAVANYLDSERRHVEDDIAYVEQRHSPFRQQVDVAGYRGIVDRVTP